MWQETWLVIGFDEMCGDPIFVDLAKPEYPVYTAMYGTGQWDPSLVAASFEGFVAALKLVHASSRGRHNPVALEKKALSRAERSALRKGLRCIGAHADMDFWLGWFEA
jgi:hypothetical protein